MRSLIVTLLVSCMAGSLVAQDSSARPAFEVASIKQTASLDRQSGRSGWEPGGRFRGVNVPGVMLVQIAYGTLSRTLLAYQLAGAPGWFSSARYDIAGKIRTDLASANVDDFVPNGPLFLRSL